METLGLVWTLLWPTVSVIVIWYTLRALWNDAKDNEGEE